MKRRRKKTHDYTEYKSGQDFIFEIIDEEKKKGYMTGSGNVACGDYIILQLDSDVYHYQVERIDYYSNPPDMWIALLVLVDERNPTT